MLFVLEEHETKPFTVRLMEWPSPRPGKTLACVQAMTMVPQRASLTHTAHRAGPDLQRRLRGLAGEVQGGPPEKVNKVSKHPAANAQRESASRCQRTEAELCLQCLNTSRRALRPNERGPTRQPAHRVVGNIPFFLTQSLNGLKEY